MVSVEVTEVDADRGRIALKLVAKHEDGVRGHAAEVGERYKEQYPNAGQAAAERPERDDGRRRRGAAAAGRRPA